MTDNAAIHAIPLSLHCTGGAGGIKTDVGSYTRDDILDNVGGHSLSDTRHALTPKGTLSANGAPVSGWFGGLATS